MISSFHADDVELAGDARVRANKVAAGVDEESIAQFEADRNRNLYKIWNRRRRARIFRRRCKRWRSPNRGARGCGCLECRPWLTRSARRGADLSGTEGRTDLSSGLERLPAGQIRGGNVPAAMLAQRLGDRSRHAKVLRHRALRPAAAQGWHSARRSSRRTRSTPMCSLTNCTISISDPSQTAGSLELVTTSTRLAQQATRTSWLAFRSAQATGTCGK